MLKTYAFIDWGREYKSRNIVVYLYKTLHWVILCHYRKGVVEEERVHSVEINWM